MRWCASRRLVTLMSSRRKFDTLHWTIYPLFIKMRHKAGNQFTQMSSMDIRELLREESRCILMTRTRQEAATTTSTLTLLTLMLLPRGRSVSTEGTSRLHTITRQTRATRVCTGTSRPRSSQTTWATLTPTASTKILITTMEVAITGTTATETITITTTKDPAHQHPIIRHSFQSRSGFCSPVLSVLKCSSTTGSKILNLGRKTQQKSTQ